MVAGKEIQSFFQKETEERETKINERKMVKKLRKFFINTIMIISVALFRHISIRPLFLREIRQVQAKTFSLI